VTGSVIATGTLEEPGTPATREITLEAEDLSPAKANAIEIGTVEEIRSTQTAEVLAIDNQPAETVVQSGSGYEVIEHPRNRDLTLTVEVAVQERSDGTVAFRGERLRVGEDLTLELEGTTITGQVTGVTE
jgi:hypothetical protein